jgi:hypothetical protein
MLTAAATAGAGNPASSYVPPSSGDPVNDKNGYFYQTSTDVSIPGRGPALDLTRTYNFCGGTSGSREGQRLFAARGRTATEAERFPQLTVIRQRGRTRE